MAFVASFMLLVATVASLIALGFNSVASCCLGISFASSNHKLFFLMQLFEAGHFNGKYLEQEFLSIKWP